MGGGEITFHRLELPALMVDADCGRRVGDGWSSSSGVWIGSVGGLGRVDWRGQSLLGDEGEVIMRASSVCNEVARTSSRNLCKFPRSRKAVNHVK